MRTLLLLSVALLWVGEIAAQDAALDITYRSGSSVIVEMGEFDGPAGEKVRSVLRANLARWANVDFDAPSPDYHLTGQVNAVPGGLMLRLVLEDSLLDMVVEDVRFRLPRAESAELRMAIHAVSDDVQEWLTGQRGFAATQIAFVGHTPLGRGLHLVDSDGENLTLLVDQSRPIVTPRWTSDGQRILYTTFLYGDARIVELNLETMEERILVERDGTNAGAIWGPRGCYLYFAGTVGSDTGILRWSPGGGAEVLIHHPGSDAFSPAISGSSLVYVTDRSGIPQIRQFDLEARREQRVRPFGRSTETQAPDISPDADRIAVQHRTSAGFQIGIYSRNGETGRALTTMGNNRDPSFAPGGNFLVYRSDLGGHGLYIMDVEAGERIRLTYGDFRYPAWSPVLLSITE